MDDYEREPLISSADSRNHRNHAEQPHEIGSNSINTYGSTVVTHDENDGREKGDHRNVDDVFSYKRRWYILFVFCFLAFLQNIVWNTWSPITESAFVAFKWTKTDIALQSNWGCITFIVSAFAFSWLMDVKGLRASCVLTAFLVASGSALRCITTELPAATWLINIGQILNGFAGPVSMAGPPLLSALWFPASQRATATSIAILSMNLGLSISFIIGPLLVPNATTHSNDSSTNNTNTDDVNETRYNIMKLMYIECLFSVAAFLAILIYFPDRPPSAPSISASSQRIDFKNGMRQLMRNLGFWKVGLSYGLTLGIGGIWGSLLNFYVIGLVDEVEAGWLGFYGSIAAGVVGCIVSRFSDVYSGHFKSILLVLFTLSLGSCVVFTLECMSILPFHRAILYSTFIVTSMLINGSAPLFYELVCETAFPIAEGLTNGVQTWLNNFVGLVFLLTFMIPSVGNSTDMQWMNWTMMGVIFICIPILLTYKETYNRLDIDTTTVEGATVQQQLSNEAANNLIENANHVMNHDVNDDGLLLRGTLNT